MRYPASEKLEIIRIVEQSHLPARRTLDQLGIARRTFYRWYDRYLEGGPEALADRPSAPSRVWNRIAPEVQDQIVEMALDYSELSPRELAVRFTDERQYFVSEATVYRLLKAHDLITSPAYVVVKAADAFHTKTTRPNEIVADRLHLLQDHRVGLDVSVDCPRRLLALHHRLETVHQHASPRRHRHAGPRPKGIRLRQRHSAAQTQTAVRQRPQLHRGRTGPIH